MSGNHKVGVIEEQIVLTDLIGTTDLIEPIIQARSLAKNIYLW